MHCLIDSILNNDKLSIDQIKQHTLPDSSSIQPCIPMQVLQGILFSHSAKALKAPLLDMMMEPTSF
jgi:hypothetical protein